MDSQATRSTKTPRAWAGLGFEVLALLTAVAVAIGLTIDDRATSLHISSLWFAVAVAFVPPVLTVRGAGRPVLSDGLAAALILFSIFGCFTIGGVALGASAFLLVVAGAIHHLITPDGGRYRRPVAISCITVGIVFFLGGAMSGTAGMFIAPIGVLLVVWGASTLGSEPDETAA